MKLESISNKLTVFIFLLCIALAGALILLDYPFATYLTDSNEVVVSDRNIVFVISHYNDLHQLEGEQGYRLLWEEPEIDSDVRFFFPAYKDFLNVSQLILSPSVGDVGQVEINRIALEDTLEIHREYDLREEKNNFFAIKLYDKELTNSALQTNDGISIESNSCIYTFKSEAPYVKTDKEYDLLIFDVVDEEINISVTRSCI